MSVGSTTMRVHQHDGSPTRGVGALSNDKKSRDERLHHAIGRSCGGMTMEKHVSCGGKGMGLSFVLTPGQPLGRQYSDSDAEGIRVQGANASRALSATGYPPSVSRGWLRQCRIGMRSVEIARNHYSAPASPQPSPGFRAPLTTRPGQGKS